MYQSTSNFGDLSIIKGDMQLTINMITTEQEWALALEEVSLQNLCTEKQNVCVSEYEHVK
jgi:hypothetical protein